MHCKDSDIDIKFTCLAENAKAPSYATSGSAAADLHALLEEPVELAPGARVVIPTGIAISLPNDKYVALIFARSGLGIKKGIALSNGVGVIDSDYRGEICVGLVNLSDETHVINPNDRIAQMAIMPVIGANYVQSQSLDATARGTGGLGSTGV